MGCDIHEFFEVRKNGKWEYVPVQEKYEVGEADEDGYRSVDYDEYFKDPPLYIGRSYNLFSILADVRNGYGFAGYDTGEGFVPISKPRGYPKDASEEARKASEDYDVDGHSHSWVTLAELEAYDWNQTTKHRGYVDEKQFKVYEEKGKPEECCGGIGGGSVLIVGNDTMRKGKKPKGRDMYTQVEWEETYADSVRWFIDRVIPALRELGKPENVRMVFFFDN